MPFDTMTFCYPWRPYQSRVLNAVHEHLNDKRLHIVAAPGAGKTTLGLEVFRILRKPTLVLSPTRVIRDQWIDRLKDFCATDDAQSLDWVSQSISSPKTLTSITYQALHVKMADSLEADQLTDEESEEAELLENDCGLKGDELNHFIQLLERHNIEVLILDEAHHLRNEWWRALEKVCEHFPNITLVSLTATPPYDSQGHEWSRYEKLCGPIDEEISVPELVKAGTLCAHQDYLWACNATLSEKQQIEEYDQRVSTLCHSLIESEAFENAVLSHPWLHQDDIEQALLKEPEIAIAILSFIKTKGLSTDIALKQLLDLTHDDIPELGRHHWQVLIAALLFSNTYQHQNEHLLFVEQLKKQLNTSELLSKRELSLERSKRLERTLSLSASKIEGCCNIHQLEFQQRGSDLRQVILTDYIRDEALISGMDTGEVNLGAWPIFNAITASSPVSNQIALLTGRLSIIPTPLLPALLTQISSQNVKTEPMGNQKQYHKVSAPLNQLTGAFTALLMRGDIKVLVGTRSLLGEGWDAPAINSLILASSVGSFMLTNQMRGRAIRIDPTNKEKISSIWHLAAINPKSITGWSDFHSLKQRFDTFVGLSEKMLTIESGFERMKATAIESPISLKATLPIAASNQQMTRRFHAIDTVAKRWHEALSLEETARVIPSVKTNKLPQIRGYLLKRSFSYLFLQLAGVVSSATLGTMVAFKQSPSVILPVLALSILGAMLYKLPKTLFTIKVVLRYLPVDGALKQIGIALAEALCQAGFVETSIRQMKVNVIKTPEGAFFLTLSGCTFYESSLFADSLHEILSPIDNPRYLVIREGKFLGMARDDYHAVPLRFGAKKDTAMIFYKSWCKNVSLSELIYTRTPDGRKRLLKGKMKAFSSNFSDEVKRQDRWS
ncbi:DEAD/DEAH box helicase family protein [Enterovibrio sp. ZSDZ42]|uniref:DEAD/DEAH box helicase family protein n=1 Tax=Enterovibrio gelatinilyticus TaxID=2899819 RepID=A0ABT5R5I4_9GAMM|nr:DEAD/DEAH box helicase family protein [Enterovibrio sp. ZSDZ42]MDD1795513.1 DEAD/DEAH box helicase family protein [Enterovibrio sp. ZSDZ42]